MRWKVTTKTKEIIVSATSSSYALKKAKVDKEDVKGVSLMPKNTVDTVKSKWRNWFGK